MIISGKDYDLNEIAEKTDGGNPIANLMGMRQYLMDEAKLSFDDASIVAREYYDLPAHDPSCNAAKPTMKSSDSSNNLIPGIILSVIGLVVVIYQSSRISKDIWYSYSSPYSEHEMSMIAIVVVGAVCLVIGLVLVIKEVTKSKTKDSEKLKSIGMQVPAENNQDKAAELSKFKDLLDNGTITQEEFEATKKKILNI